MEKIKAAEVSICVFTWKNYPSLNDYPADEKAAFNAFAGVVTDLRKKHGNDIPVFLDYCPLTNTQNQVIASNLGITDFPAVQIFARFSDGSTAQYAVTKDLGDKFTGINWDKKDVAPYVEALLYQRKPAEASILCKIFPPLCNLGAWVWLAGAAYSTLEFAKARSDSGRIAWGAAAGLTWQSFFASGGFNGIGIGAGNDKKGSTNEQ